jgi:hypothetical protein
MAVYCCHLLVLSLTYMRLVLNIDKPKKIALLRLIVNMVSQEERSIFWEVIVSVILSKRSVYVHVSYSKRFPR